MAFEKRIPPEMIDSERQVNQEVILSIAPFMQSFYFKKTSFVSSAGV